MIGTAPSNDQVFDTGRFLFPGGGPVVVREPAGGGHAGDGAPGEELPRLQQGWTTSPSRSNPYIPILSNTCAWEEMIKGLEKLKESNKIARYKRKIFVHQGQYIWLVIGGVGMSGRT